MMEYTVRQCLYGFVVYKVGEIAPYDWYAFSTLQEAIEHLPKLFETKEK